MTIIIQKKRPLVGESYIVPAGGEILFYGIASLIPAGFTIDTYCKNVFVRGVDTGGASNTQAGSFNHGHTSPANTDAAGLHNHNVQAGSTGTTAASQDAFNGSYTYESSAVSHSHSYIARNTDDEPSHSHALSSVIALDVYPPYKKLYWIKAVTDVECPVGAIIMFDDVIANRPAGFELCDGLNATLDMRNAFVYGADIDGDIGDAGGSATHIHDIPDTQSIPAHRHGYNYATSGPSSLYNNSVSNVGTIYVPAEGHTHTFNLETSDADGHVHSFTNDTGVGSSLPAYLMLYFVQRVV